MISTIIINHNNGNFIEAALQSVIKQTYKPDEIIIYDNNSKDNSIEKIENYIKKYNLTIKLVRLPFTSNLFEIRKMALNTVKTKYISFLNGSNFYLPTKLEESLKLISLYDNIFCAYTDFTIFNMASRKEERIFNPTYNPANLLNGFIPQMDNLFNTELSIKLFKSNNDVENYKQIANSAMLISSPLNLYYIRN